MSSSEVLRAARSNAKFGAAEYALLLVASICIQRAGRCRKDAGLVSTAGMPARIGRQIPTIRPMS
ncbi:Uncharacterised protein [Mycobacterium tuberculosis]|nr:Uncharacterised protein [Mycobacterium tuberculosis]